MLETHGLCSCNTLIHPTKKSALRGALFHAQHKNIIILLYCFEIGYFALKWFDIVKIQIYHDI